MILSIDINDTYRALTRQIAINYQKAFSNPDWNIDNLKYPVDDLWAAFPFVDESINDKWGFLNEQYSFEVYGSAHTVEKNLAGQFNLWYNNIFDYDGGNNLKIKLICPDENYLCIQSTYFFLSKSACRVRYVEFPTSTAEIWENSDVVVSADPRVLRTKPIERKYGFEKTAIKIVTPYNSSVQSDFTYASLSDFMKSKNYFKILGISL